MSSWPTKKLAEVADVIRGVSFDKSEVVDSAATGYTPILRAGNIGEDLDTADDLLWVPDHKVVPGQLMKPGDVAICMSSGSAKIVGKSASLESDWRGSVGAFCAIIRFHGIHPRFGAHWLRGPRFQLWRNSQAQGANIQNLRKAELEQLELPVPSLTEQERIVRILDEAEALCRLRAETDERTAAIEAALFQSFFGAPSTNLLGWETMSVGELFDRNRGGVKCGPFGSALRKDEYSETGVPVWGIPNVLPNRFLEAGSLFIPRTKYLELRSYEVKPGNILVSRAGTVGRICVANPTASESIIGTNLIRLALDKNRVLPEFFATLLTHFASDVGQLRADSSETSYSFMNTTALKDLRIYLPPIDLQESFSVRIAELRRLETPQAASRQRLDDLFQSLLHRAFQGEL